MLEEKVEEDVEEKSGNEKLRCATPISNLKSECHQRHPNFLFSEFSLPCQQLYAGATNLGLFKYRDS